MTSAPVAPLTWAIIGTGTISYSVAEDLRLEGGRIGVVHSRTRANADRFAERFAVPRATDDYEKVLADDEIDVVYIATPFATHFDLASRAIAVGKHVLVEKPMALTTAEVEELFTRARAAGVFLMEAMWTKFTPGFIRFMSEIQNGRIGRPRSLRASFGIAFPPGGSRWDLDGSPGTLLDQGIYPVTLAHALFGEPIGIHAAGTLRDDGLDIAEHFTLEFPDGRFAQGAASMTEFLDLTAAVAGDKGWIVIPGMFWAMNALEIHADDQRTMFVEPDTVAFPRDGNGYRPMLAAVTRAIREGLTEHPVHTASDTIAVFRVLDAIRSGLTR